MKVYFMNSFLEGCWYVRSLLPMVAGGWDGDKTSLRSERMKPDAKARGSIDADVCVFHRPNDQRAIDAAKILKRLGRKIVMDNDDTYKGSDDMKLGNLLESVDKSLDEFGRNADLITCSTEFLANEYRKLNKRVVVLKNCVDPDDWPEPLRNEGEKVRIGFVGSVALNGDFEGFIPTLQELNKREDVQLVLFSLPAVKDNQPVVNGLYKDDVLFWNALNIEWHPFVDMVDYFDTLNELKLDIMVIPRKDNYFNRCKSNIKFLEASMLEIPVVAQGFSDGNSPYQTFDSGYMDVVVDDTKWMDALDPLIKNKQLRRERGARAREYVLNNYNIHENVWRWEEAYKSI